jgi:hypothetical protein
VIGERDRGCDSDGSGLRELLPGSRENSAQDAASRRQILAGDVSPKSVSHLADGVAGSVAQLSPGLCNSDWRAGLVAYLEEPCRGQIVDVRSRRGLADVRPVRASSRSRIAPKALSV